LDASQADSAAVPLLRELIPLFADLIPLFDRVAEFAKELFYFNSLRALR
jgi:hypothetical protein